MKVLVFGNVHQPPFVNNLLPMILGLEKLAEVRLVEPFRIAGFVSTGGARPALIPSAAVDPIAREFDPDAVFCLGGGLYLDDRSRQVFPPTTIFAGFAFSDPHGLPASLQVAHQFDLFYTSDPHSIPTYHAQGIEVRRCDPAIDTELYYPMGIEPQHDVIFYGKWTPLRDQRLAELARRFDVRLHAHQGESRWSIPARPPLNDPESLCRAINGARLQLEIAFIDDAEPPARGVLRITNRPQIAAACGVPSLIEDFQFLPDFFEPGTEIETYGNNEELLERTEALLRDESRRKEMGRAARARVLRDHTWVTRFGRVLQEIAAFRADHGRS